MTRVWNDLLHLFRVETFINYFLPALAGALSVRESPGSANGQARPERLQVLGSGLGERPVVR
jgi:hypothetical protein